MSIPHWAPTLLRFRLPKLAGNVVVLKPCGYAGSAISLLASASLNGYTGRASAAAPSRLPSSRRPRPGRRRGDRFDRRGLHLDDIAFQKLRVDVARPVTGPRV